jgi:hypothetical protein
MRGGGLGAAGWAVLNEYNGLGYINDPNLFHQTHYKEVHDYRFARHTPGGGSLLSPSNLALAQPGEDHRRHNQHVQ